MSSSEQLASRWLFPHIRPDGLCVVRGDDPAAIEYDVYAGSQPGNAEGALVNAWSVPGENGGLEVVDLTVAGSAGLVATAAALLCTAEGDIPKAVQPHRGSFKISGTAYSSLSSELCTELMLATGMVFSAGALAISAQELCRRLRFTVPSLRESSIVA